jgi:hypothetical protein
VVNRGISLDLLREVRDRLAFVDTPLLGYISTAARPVHSLCPGRRSARGKEPLGGSPPSRPAPTAQAPQGGGGRGEGSEGRGGRSWVVRASPR